jgi:hypothetical protein
LSIDTDECEIERRLARMHADRLLHNGYAGRQLYRLFRQGELIDIVIELFPMFTTDYPLARLLGRFDDVERQALAAGIITPDELRRWHAALHHADATGTFFASLSMIMAAGRKPEDRNAG